MFATPAPGVDNPKASGRYLSKYSPVAIVAAVYAKPDPIPEIIKNLSKSPSTISRLIIGLK